MTECSRLFKVSIPLKCSFSRCSSTTRAPALQPILKPSACIRHRPHYCVTLLTSVWLRQVKICFQQGFLQSEKSKWVLNNASKKICSLLKKIIINILLELHLILTVSNYLWTFIHCDMCVLEGGKLMELFVCLYSLEGSGLMSHISYKHTPSFGKCYVLNPLTVLLPGQVLFGAIHICPVESGISINPSAQS